MAMIQCPQCAQVLEASVLSRHKNRYHSTPVPVLLLDGSTNQVVNLEVGYRCWCGSEIQTRDACQKHVRKHLSDGNAAVFLQTTGK